MDATISIDDLKRLAFEMVAANHLNMIYGNELFAQAQVKFEEGLKQFAKQAAEARPLRQNTSLVIPTEPSIIPDFLKNQ